MVGGLNGIQWLWCIIIGSISLVVNILLKCIKEDSLPMVIF